MPSSSSSSVHAHLNGSIANCLSSFIRVLSELMCVLSSMDKTNCDNMDAILFFCFQFEMPYIEWEDEQ